MHNLAESGHLEKHLQIWFGKAIDSLVLADDHEDLEASLLEYLVHVFGGLDSHNCLFRKGLDILFGKHFL